jgi:diguanylate cyclase (GGDEF)-like protein
MLNIIDSLANLTALRDRDELEMGVLSMIHSWVEPSQLILWRVTGSQTEPRLMPRAELIGQAVIKFIPPFEIAALPLLDLYPELRACWDRKALVCLGFDDIRRHGYIFPITYERRIIGFLEIFEDSPMSGEQKKAVFTILRLYCNLLRFLDYGEYDELTGLLNRKTFDTFFRNVTEANVHRSGKDSGFLRVRLTDEAEDSHKVWLAVVDIDFFKRINDQFGHLYGDEVLVLMARLMRKCFRESDHLLRSGGEEFVVILGHMDEQFAARALERFRLGTEAFQFPQVGQVTVSIGYTCVREDDNSSAAYGRADEALYIAKQRGRNQVRSYEKLIAERVLKARALAGNEVEIF